MPSPAGTEVTLPIAPRPAADLRLAEDMLDALPLFASLSAKSRQRLIAAGTIRRYAAGTTFFRAGDPSAGLFVILIGEARVLRARAGRQRVIHTEGPGGTLGEVPLFEGGTMPADAEAITPVRCLHISESAIHVLIRSDPSIALLFLHRLAGRVRALVERLDRDSTLPLATRLAAFVLARSVAARAESFSLGMTQEALAEELGTVREVVVRGLAQLRRDDVIASAGRGRFSVRDVETLRALARG